MTLGKKIAAAYLGVVVAGLVVGFGQPVHVYMPAVFAVMLLTLPLSIVSFLFWWSLIHGAAIGVLTIVYSVCALVNALVITWLVDRNRGRRQQPAD
jgi:hypothetical protein